VIIEKVMNAPSPRTALAAFADGTGPFLLESAERNGGFGRFSFAGVDPFLTLATRGRGIEVHQAGEKRVHEGDPWEEIRRRLSRFQGQAGTDGRDIPTPFPAGAVGFFSYDLCRQLERIGERARDDLDLPDVCLSFHDAVVTWDHESGETWVASTGFPLDGPAGRRRAMKRARDLARRLESARQEEPSIPGLSNSLLSTFSRQEYVEAVARAKDLIAAGDMFQVNLSQRFSMPTTESGRAIYNRLAVTNPAAFAAYFPTPCGAEVVSASPERFLRISGSRMETSPIKGTRPRGATPAEDRHLAEELKGSEKDRAELTMIVDLMRNDLGRVARFGSVRVAEFPALTSHATVHHLHGTVVARLAEGKDVVDVLRASFPGGSITGAPKVRAMEVIEDVEPVRRGVYTGSIGYLSCSGEVDLNIAIRTILVKNGQASFSVGGGIVADSDPEKEYEETLHKGRGIGAALGLQL